LTSTRRTSAGTAGWGHRRDRCGPDQAVDADEREHQAAQPAARPGADRSAHRRAHAAGCNCVRRFAGR